MPLATLLFCSVLVLAMAGSMSFPALIPVLTPHWQLSGAEAGWIGGVYFFGHMLAVPLTSSLCDRMDPRRVVIGGLVLSLGGSAGFAYAADGFWTAMLWRAVAGAGLAGVYIPGLNALTDRVAGPRQSRHVAFYTASYSIGTALSVLLTGRVEAVAGWEMAVLAGAGGPAFALLLVAYDLSRVGAPPRPALVFGGLGVAVRALLDFRPVLRNRPAMGFVLGYVAHMWELHSFRTWTVAFLAAGLSAAGQTDATAASGVGRWAATDVATVIFLLGMPASILGNELAMRFGRRRTVMIMMWLAAAFGGGLGWLIGLPSLVPVAAAAFYCVAVMWDSAALTAGAVAAAEPGRKGATMAVHASLGFLAAALGPLVFGQVLDLAGGATANGFGFAFLSAACVAALGPFALLRLVRPSSQTDHGKPVEARQDGELKR